MPDLLIQLEQTGVTEVRWLLNPRREANNDPVIRSIEDRLTQAGVDHAFSVPTSEPGISFTATKPGGAVSGRDVVEAVEKEAWKQDNRSKLEEMATDEAT